MTEHRQYRGLTPDGKLVKGDLVTLYYPKRLCIAQEGNTQDWSNTRFDEVLPESVGQSTGLKDRKRTDAFPEGQDIYQGDDLKVGHRTYTIKIDSFHGYRFLWGSELLTRSHAIDGEVVGCHQHPELLEGG